MATLKQVGQMPQVADEAPMAAQGPGVPGMQEEGDAEQEEYTRMLHGFVGNMREGIFGGDTPDGQTSSVVQALLAPGPEGVSVAKVADAAAQVTLMTWGAGVSQGVEIPWDVAMGAVLVAAQDMMAASGQQWDSNEKGQIRHMAMKHFQEGALEQGLVTPEEVELLMDEMQADPEGLDQALMELDPEGAQVLIQEAGNMSVPGRGAHEAEMMQELAPAPMGPSMGGVQ